MEVTVEEISPLTKKLKIVLPGDQVSREMDLAYRKLQGEVTLKGFRKGKVPRKILEKQYAPKVTQEVVTKLVQDTYFDAVGKAKLDPVVHPEIRNEKMEADGGFSYEAEVDIRPSFELGDYFGIEVEKAPVEVSESEVDAALEELRRRLAPLRSTEDREVRDGDIVLIDYQAFENGMPVKALRAEGYSVEVGSGRNGKEFEDALCGLRKGEESEREVVFPPTFNNPVLAGKTLSFRITVQDVKERVLAPLDDELAKDVGGSFKSLAELREHIRAEQLKKKAETEEGGVTDKIMHHLLERHSFEVPARLVAFETDELIREFENNLQRQGLTLESAGIERQKLTEQYRDTAERRVRGDFILKKISEQEDIKLTNEEINQGFQRLAERYRMTVPEVKGYFKSRDDLLPFMNELLNEKILAVVREKAVVRIAGQEQENTAPAGAEAAGEPR